MKLTSGAHLAMGGSCGTSLSERERERSRAWIASSFRRARPRWCHDIACQLSENSKLKCKTSHVEMCRSNRKSGFQISDVRNNGKDVKSP